MKAREDQEFPSHNVFERIGSKAERARKVIEYCQAREDLHDVIAICKPVAASSKRTGDTSKDDETKIGFVYLVRSGRSYKIGHTYSVGRRGYELAIQLPERPKLIHKIKTDDPVGIEKYWHSRFSDRRKGGEWFALSASDVRAFKRRTFM